MTPLEIPSTVSPSDTAQIMSAIYLLRCIGIETHSVVSDDHTGGLEAIRLWGDLKALESKSARTANVSMHTLTGVPA